MKKTETIMTGAACAYTRPLMSVRAGRVGMVVCRAAVAVLRLLGARLYVVAATGAAE